MDILGGYSILLLHAPYINAMSNLLFLRGARIAGNGRIVSSVGHPALCSVRAASLNSAIGKGLRKSKGVGFRGKEKNYGADRGSRTRDEVTPAQMTSGGRKSWSSSGSGERRTPRENRDGSQKSPGRYDTGSAFAGGKSSYQREGFPRGNDHGRDSSFADRNSIYQKDRSSSGKEFGRSPFSQNVGKPSRDSGFSTSSQGHDRPASANRFSTKYGDSNTSRSSEVPSRKWDRPGKTPSHESGSSGKFGSRDQEKEKGGRDSAYKGQSFGLAESKYSTQGRYSKENSYNRRYPGLQEPSVSGPGENTRGSYAGTSSSKSSSKYPARSESTTDRPYQKSSRPYEKSQDSFKIRPFISRSQDRIPIANDRFSQSEKPTSSPTISGDAPSEGSPIRSFKTKDQIPLSIPYTTTASEFLYGTSVVEAALTSRRIPSRQFYKLYIFRGENGEQANRDSKLENLARKAGVRVERVNREWLPILDKMSEGRPHNGYILEASPLPRHPVTSLQEFTWKDGQPGLKVVLDHQSREEAAINGTSDFVKISPLASSRNPFVLLLDSIVDPQNLGGIIRTASFLGVSAVAISTRNSASFTPVVLKASAGASENITIFSVNKPAGFIADSQKAGWKIYAAVAPGNRDPNMPTTLSTNRLEHQDPLSTHPCILMLGNEGEGLRSKLVHKADFGVTIRGSPYRYSVDSLNVNVAAGILCSSFVNPTMDAKLPPEATEAIEIPPPSRDLF